jgi:hypothetical protein
MRQADDREHRFHRGGQGAALVKASTSRAAALVCHPATPSEAVHGIETRVGWTDGGALAFTHILKGDLTRLRIPPPGRAQRADRLWRHTCFEAFISVKDEREYYEFDFAPSGEWAVYAFLSYRESAPLTGEIPAPEIAVRRAEESLELDAVVSVVDALKIRRGASLKLALAAVIEDASGTLTYWALKHGAEKPDFHRTDGFVLEIEAPSRKADE